MTWKRKAKAIAAKHGWQLEYFFQGGVSVVKFVDSCGAKLLAVEFDRELLDELSEEPLWKGLCRLYFDSVPGAASEAEITLVAEVSSDGC